MKPLRNDDPSAPAALGDIPEAEFRRAGHLLIDWIADHLAHPERLPVMARTRPGEVRALLPAAPPEAPVPLEAQWEQFLRAILPAITHWNHPAFLAYFGISGSYPGILGELIAAALNVNAMLWKTSPAATELEELALDWLRQALGLASGWFGVIMDTASVSSFVAMAAARERTGLAIRERGLAGRPELPPLTAYCSGQAHSSIDKAAIGIGIGHAQLRKIPVDEAFRMRPEALAEAIAADRRAGRRPFFVCATVGTTSTTSIDPVEEIAALCAREGLWLHVDGAYGGMAALLPERRAVLAGVERADSLVVNPHKWLFTPIDCSAFYTRDPAAVRGTFNLVPEYLRTGEGEPMAGYPAHNLMDYGIALGRRLRALKLWMVLNTFGLEGLRARLREHIRLGQWLATQIDAHPDFERLAPTPLSVVCFRCRPHAPKPGASGATMPSMAVMGGAEAPGEPDRDGEARLNALNQALLERLNASGRLFLSHTVLEGRYALRVAIGNIRTDQAMIEAVWAAIRETAAELAREGMTESG